MKNSGPPEPTAAPPGTLPLHVAMGGAEVVERSPERVVFAWRGQVPPGANPVASSVETTLLMPADFPLALGARLSFDNATHDLELEIADASGQTRCSSSVGFEPDRTAPAWGCAVPVPPLPSDEAWTVRVFASRAMGTVPFEVEVDLRAEPLVQEVYGALPEGAPPGCDVRRSPLAHGAAEPVEADAALPVPCFMRTGLVGWEPSLGITASGAVFASGRQAAGVTVGGFGAVASFDEGGTWGLILPGVSGVSTHPLSVDPYLYVDPITSRVFVDDMVSADCSVLSWSDDEGATWEHALSSCEDFDHQTIFAGPPVISPTIGYPNVVYSCAINTVALQGAGFTSTCSKSLNGGRTFTTTGEPAFYPDPSRTGDQGIPGWCGGAHGHGIADGNGRIFLPKGHCGQPHLAMSQDEGLTWRRVQVSDLGMPTIPFVTGDFFGHEAAVGVDPEGTIYYAWVANDRLPYLVVSRDAGAKWSDPVAMAPPGLVEASQPALTVGGAGKLAFVYLGSFDSPGAPWDGDYSATTWHGMLTVSYDANAAEPTFLTTSANHPADPLARGPCGPLACANIGDFIDVRIAPDGSVWAPYVDNCRGCWLFDDAPLDVRELVVGRFWGGASLWDGDDPNGPFPGAGPGQAERA